MTSVGGCSLIYMMETHALRQTPMFLFLFCMRFCASPRMTSLNPPPGRWCRRRLVMTCRDPLGGGGGGASSAHADILEPVGPAVLLVEEGFAVGEPARDAALALSRVGAVEEGDVLVADVAEPWGGGSVSVSQHGQGEGLTSECGSRPQTAPGPRCGRGHRPSARKRSRRRGRGG